MTRQNKLIALIAYLLILALVMIIYSYNRATRVKRLRADLARISAMRDKTRAAEIELSRLTQLVPAEADSPAFVEWLYLLARESGLKQHEVATEAGRGSGTARPGGSDPDAIARLRLKISATGSYRNFAEYIRRLQNSERFSRIIDFKLVPDAGQIKGTLTVELYSLPGKHR